jgi:hypothetical protein
VRALRRLCVLALVLVVAGVTGGMVWALDQRSAAQSRRTAAQVESDTLSAELERYSEVVRVRTEADRLRTAIDHGMRNEVIWVDVIAMLAAALPDWALAESLDVEIMFDEELREDDSPFVADVIIGTVTFEISVPALEASGALLTALDAAPGLHSATFTAVERDEETSLYRTSGTVLIDSSVRSGRFGERDEPAAEAADVPAGTEET